MTPTLEALIPYLLSRLRQVEETLGSDTTVTATQEDSFADHLDSMGMVEFLAIVAEDCDVTPGAIEACVNRQFSTVAGLARSMASAGLLPRGTEETRAPAAHIPQTAAETVAEAARGNRSCWLSEPSVCLPATVQSAALLNALLQRPAGWLESHAGITSRHVWADQDPLHAAVEAGRDCLERAGLLVEEVGALLVTSEAPPLLIGQAAALHHRLDLRPEAVALEIGGACTGFLAALWTARALLPQTGTVLLLAVEAPSRFLPVQPGRAGEAAALFGDVAAACMLCERAREGTVSLRDVSLGADGNGESLLQIERTATGSLALQMAGTALARRAVRVMSQAVFEMAQRHRMPLSELSVVAHGGNGRLPALLARRLGLPAERVWSVTSHTGNLGSASLLAARAAHQLKATGPLVWTAVGAGLTWGAALTV